MQQSVMKAWWDSSHMSGGNATYVEDMYEAYLEDAQSVSEEWRSVFDKLPDVPEDVYVLVSSVLYFVNRLNFLKRLTCK